MEIPSLRYFFAGGGTGGHVYPAIAIADEIRRTQPQSEIFFVGIAAKAEGTIVPKAGYPLLGIHSEGFPGSKLSPALLHFVIRILIGTWESIRLIWRYKPDVIVGMGGYVSAPVIFAAMLLRRLYLAKKLKIYIHEQNTNPGLLNRLVGQGSDRIGVAFHVTKVYFPGHKTEYVGYPVRARFYQPVEVAAVRQEMGLTPEKKVVLVFGGSQGARTINRAIVDALPNLAKLDDIVIIHGTGGARAVGYDPVGDTNRRIQELIDRGELSRPLDSFYRQKEYFYDIDRLYKIADLVITRGGAGTIKEIIACKTPALIIPKIGLSGDHQVMNAEFLRKHQAGEVILEEPVILGEKIVEWVDGMLLAEKITALLTSPDKRHSMRLNLGYLDEPDALGNIVTDINALISQRQLPSKPAPFKTTQLVDFHEVGNMNATRLLGYVKRETEKLSAEEVRRLPSYDYLTYRAKNYLIDPAWQMRNIGVKLFGHLRLIEKIDILLFMFHDRTKQPLLLRLLGGDYIQNGFIRRNILAALAEMGHFDDRIVRAIQAGLRDPYFEVQTMALKLIQQFAPLMIQADPAILAKIESMLHLRNFEVKVEAIRTLGLLSEDPNVIEKFRPYFLRSNCRIRNAIVLACQDLVRRGIITDQAKLEAVLRSILLTSSNFQPLFPLKQNMKNTYATLDDLKQPE
jgi:UDP-N-acetylglucosamine--N-acetylmuramyl-(pentapeptide) pyrophosphoryl-undecaprenol N-acetylglucosamine transferase